MIGRFSEQVRSQVVDLSWPLVPYAHALKIPEMRGNEDYRDLQGGFQSPDTKLSRKGASLSMFDNLSIKTSIEILLVQKTKNRLLIRFYTFATAKIFGVVLVVSLLSGGFGRS